MDDVKNISPVYVTVKRVVQNDLTAAVALCDTNPRRVALGFYSVPTGSNRVAMEGTDWDTAFITLPNEGILWLWYKDVGPLVWESWYSFQKSPSLSCGVIEVLKQ